MIYFNLEVKMENQINIGNQNNQQIDQNPVNKPLKVSGKPKTNYWVISTVFLFALLIISAIYILKSINFQTYLDNSGQKSQSQNESVPTSKIDSETGKNLEKHPLPYYSVHFKLYAVIDTSTFNTSIFDESREINPKVIKLLELESFQGEIVSVIWSQTTDDNKQKFILKTIGPGDTSSDYLLRVDGSPAVKLDFPYTFYRFFEVLTWIDENRILVKQTDQDENSPETVTTYWIAPVTDLSQKKIVSF